MTAKVSFFRVGNGDMTLITLQSGRTILIDCNIRAAADDASDETADVASQLRARLRTDDADRLYVDAMILSHPDADHCRGLEKHFHLGPIADYDADGDKIVIREMWSSPMVFRRACRNHTLCSDAKAWNREAKRRVKVFKDEGACKANERVRIMGEDEDGKTDEGRYPWAMMHPPIPSPAHWWSIRSKRIRSATCSSDIWPWVQCTR